MAIHEARFENEKELETWAFENHTLFFPGTILLEGFRIETQDNKGGVPDGFIFDFDNRQWWIVECELIRHGVWPHIAEQITRFLVATDNPSTHRKIRNNLFSYILENNLIESISKILNTEPMRLLEQIELFIESIPASLAIFIDETNEDLKTFCKALNISADIFCIKKYIVNGQPEYYSPNKNLPSVVFEANDNRQIKDYGYKVIEQLGGGEILESSNKYYKLKDGRLVKIQYSKYHEKNQYFWYGVTPAAIEKAKHMKCSDFVFVMAEDGFIVLPIAIIEKYLETAYRSEYPDGSIRHYHIIINPPPEMVLRGGYEGASEINVAEFYRSFE